MFRAWLRRQFTPIKRRYILVNIGMTGLNAGLLTLLVSVGVNPIVANLGRTTVTTQIQFGIHRIYTCRERRDESIWQQWRRYHVLKAGATASNQVLFMGLVTLCSAPYLVAYILSISIVGMANFVFMLKFVFRKINRDHSVA